MEINTISDKWHSIEHGNFILDNHGMYIAEVWNSQYGEVDASALIESAPDILNALINIRESFANICITNGIDVLKNLDYINATEAIEKVIL